MADCPEAIFSGCFAFLVAMIYFAAMRSVKQAKLLLGVFARHIDLNVGAEDAVVFDGFRPADELPRESGSWPMFVSDQHPTSTPSRNT